jgi:hypothetical protein
MLRYCIHFIGLRLKSGVERHAPESTLQVALRSLARKRGRGGSLVTRNWFAHRALYSVAIGVK